MYGNNVETSKIRRIYIPMFTQDNPSVQPGLKYFFPEDPEIDRNNIVGIEANIVYTPAKAAGDISSDLNNIITQAGARNVYLNFYDQNNEEIYYNLPLRSLFTYAPFSTGFRITKRIKPFFGKIKTRSCYAYIPANIPPAPSNNKIYLSLSFYYNN